jgi:hypothetical protein
MVYIGGFVGQKQKNGESNADIFEKINKYLNELSSFNAAERNWMQESVARNKCLSNIRSLTAYLVRKGVTLEQFNDNIKVGLFTNMSLFHFKDWKKLNEKI